MFSRKGNTDWFSDTKQSTLKQHAYIIQTEQIMFRIIHVYTYMHVTIITTKGHGFGREYGGMHGRVWKCSWSCTPPWWHTSVTLTSSKSVQKDQKFRNIFGYKESLRLSWATLDPKTNKSNKNALP